ncbi:YitT family protein [Tuanshanicoccus lijuaniae]|uniref:YitT family protein n=1 Tax=Aerococcaceae bacterium zg-1292 TaxID=2774330 RepID=UPI001935B907|nr:YitT family protein [Aerococcaceae bacterium zg-1292]MBF6626470.1 YitT family protein [Aerococcaceae bacterium zg-BR9]MBF6979249.1 YitT family protein [Aerococcaceae bacterium zg-BR22]MBS4455799.1 YitT family protein [Aerococcaceae bacterium zg-A91]MBS4457662.1 YitT family protein [Aerococcaceae bacterium zg-BR33]
MLNKYLSEHPKANFLMQVLIALVSSIIFGVAMNFFLIPGEIFSSGVPGLAQLINFFTSKSPLAGILTTGNLYFLLNVPLLILSYLKLGRHFTLMTIIVVIFSTITTNIIPVTYVSQNPLLNAIMGGVFSGAGAGITIKYGMSGGGFDILNVFLAKTFGWNVGSLTFLSNLIVIVGSGMLYTWELAIYTMITIFVTSKMIDTIHTNEQRLTAFIVTNNPADVTANIRMRLIRGTTILEARGGYTGDKRDVLMIVINRYELHELQLAIAEADQNAFVNVVQSTKVMGNFLNRDQQLIMRKQNQVLSK